MPSASRLARTHGQPSGGRPAIVLGQNSAVGHLARWLEDKAPQKDSPEHDFDAVAMIWLAQSKTIGPNGDLKPPGVFVSAMVGRSCAGEPTAARPLPADVPWVK